MIGISTDTEHLNLARVKTPREAGGLGKIGIPIVSDNEKDISRKYGVLKEDEGIVLRATFIIDGKGILRSSVVTDLPLARNVEEILNTVQAFRFTDEHPQTNPPSWSTVINATM